MVTWLACRSDLIGALRELQAQAPADVLVVLRVYFDDAVDWTTFGRCTNCGVPGLYVGQLYDCRYPAGDGQGLHGHAFETHIEFHLDACDACANVVGHAVRDTELVPGGLIGAAVGGLLGGLLGGPRGALAGIGLGGFGGAAIGATVPRRSRRQVVELRTLPLSQPSRPLALLSPRS